MVTKNLLLSGSSSESAIRKAVTECSDSCLFSGSIEYTKSSFFYFSFVNKESLSYILNEIKLEPGVKVEIKKHDGDAERVQQEENKLPSL